MAVDLPGAMLDRLRGPVEAQARSLDDPFPQFVLALSFSDGASRAKTVFAARDTFETAWEELRAALKTQGKLVRFLRVDWVEAASEIGWDEFRLWLRQTKRNYFRFGVSLDRGFRTAFLEMELNANAMLYGGGAAEHAVVNEGNFARYAKNARGLQSLETGDDGSLVHFSTRAVFTEAGDMVVHPIAPGGTLDAGRRVIKRLEIADVDRLIESGSGFLAGQVEPSGRFVYGWHPCFNRRINAYNCLRHASTVYAMVEAWDLTRDPALKSAIDRALSYLTDELIMTVDHEGQELAFLVEANGEIKLGGNAVCLLALVKYCETVGTNLYLPLLEKLAAGILHMQDRESGRFVHVLSYPDLTVREAFRIIYYDGEAAFGLMRLYTLTGDARWLDAVERAFGHFIAAEHWKAHDHWLSYAVNQLTRYRPRREYFTFGIRNFIDHLGFVAERVTTFPTLLELMMAAREMISRLEESGEHADLLRQIDLDTFHDALEARAHHLLNGHFWPELAMFYARPEAILGSFFIRHHAFRVRIDDVEHYLSGYVAYRKYLAAGGRSKPADSHTVAERVAADAGAGACWSPEEVASATGGTWIHPPRRHWRAAGLSIHAPTFRPRQMVALRLTAEERGMSLQRITELPSKPSAVITSRLTRDVLNLGVPVLRVVNAGAAVLALGRAARERIAGKVLAITGSAGKTTTVAMLARSLSAFGRAQHSQDSGNLPHGVSWNLASLRPDNDFNVLEVAIGRMRQSAAIVRPDVAVITNIFPVHLGPSDTLADIARTKAAIFEGMSAGSVAVLNREMHEWDRVLTAAQAADLRIVCYGEAPDSDFRLVEYSPNTGRAVAETPVGRIAYRVEAPGRHMALNGLACLACVWALGHELEPACAQIATFAPLAGRGQAVALDFGGVELRVIDDAYNANPGSMSAALERLHHEPASGRKVAVLGQMSELGRGERKYHIDLADHINALGIDRVYAVGGLYEGFWQQLEPERRGALVDDIEALKPVLRTNLRAGDTVLLKGSNSTGIHRLVPWLKAPTTYVGIVPQGVSTLLYSTRQDRVLASTDPLRLHRPASITKLLTLCLVHEKMIERGETGNGLATIAEDARSVDSWWGFLPGEKVRLEDLMRASAVVSANEASNALALWHSGSIEAFTQCLNEGAKALGMHDTVLASPSGLGRRQSTTVHDVLLLARHIYARHQEVAVLCSERSFSWNGRTYPGTNTLLDQIEGGVGLKTGSLGGNVHNVAFAWEHGGDRLIAIVLGAPTRSMRSAIVQAMAHSVPDAGAAASGSMPAVVKRAVGAQDALICGSGSEQ